MTQNRWTDTDFNSREIYAVRPPKNRLSTIFILASIALLATFLIWARGAEIEEVTRGEGKIVPSARIQIVQSLEGGILGAIHVSEGQEVKAGQLLLNIDDTMFSASLEEVDAQRQALLGKIARLETELSGAGQIKYPEGFDENSPTIMASENKLFQARRTSLNNEVRVLRSRREQRNQEYKELVSTNRRLSDELDLARQELSLKEQVADLVPEAELLAMRRDVSRINGEINVNKNSQSRARAAINEADSLIVQARSNYREESQAALTDAEAQLSVIMASSKSAGDRVDRAGLKSPVDGIINALHVNTLGGVIKPGSDLVEIVPYGETLQIEAKIRPKDIAFLSPKQKARVTITAYDYSIYGGLEGYVERIGADSLTDEITGETYFPIDILADAANFKKDNETLPISPGMVASVDIITGKKTILQYLLKPINKARYEGLKER